MLGVGLLVGAYNIVLDIAFFRRSNQGQQTGGRIPCMEFFFFCLSFLSFSLFKKLQAFC